MAATLCIIFGVSLGSVLLTYHSGWLRAKGGSVSVPVSVQPSLLPFCLHSQQTIPNILNFLFAIFVLFHFFAVPLAVSSIKPIKHSFHILFEL